MLFNFSNDFSTFFSSVLASTSMSRIILRLDFVFSSAHRNLNPSRQCEETNYLIIKLVFKQNQIHHRKNVNHLVKKKGVLVIILVV